MVLTSKEKQAMTRRQYEDEGKRAVGYAKQMLSMIAEHMNATTVVSSTDLQWMAQMANKMQSATSIADRKAKPAAQQP